MDRQAQATRYGQTFGRVALPISCQEAWRFWGPLPCLGVQPLLPSRWVPFIPRAFELGASGNPLARKRWGVLTEGPGGCCCFSFSVLFSWSSAIGMGPSGSSSQWISVTQDSSGHVVASFHGRCWSHQPHSVALTCVASSVLCPRCQSQDRMPLRGSAMWEGLWGPHR